MGPYKSQFFETKSLQLLVSVFMLSMLLTSAFFSMNANAYGPKKSFEREVFTTIDSISFGLSESSAKETRTGIEGEQCFIRLSEITKTLSIPAIGCYFDVGDEINVFVSQNEIRIDPTYASGLKFAISFFIFASLLAAFVNFVILIILTINRWSEESNEIDSLYKTMITKNNGGSFANDEK